MQDPTYLTTTDIAKRYGVNSDTARRWIRIGKIPAVRIGRGYLVRLDLLESLEHLTLREDTNLISLCDNE